jgi:predicted RNA-binding protein YlxR (DUF448 family)
VAEGRLVRLAATIDGSVEVGRTLPGRGAWVCGGDSVCLTRALRRKVLVRALRADIGHEAAEQLLDQLRAHFPAASPDARD